jgi:hypothetical protein
VVNSDWDIRYNVELLASPFDIKCPFSLNDIPTQRFTACWAAKGVSVPVVAEIEMPPKHRGTRDSGHKSAKTNMPVTSDGRIE